MNGVNPRSWANRTRLPRDGSPCVSGRRSLSTCARVPSLWKYPNKSYQVLAIAGSWNFPLCLLLTSVSLTAPTKREQTIWGSGCAHSSHVHARALSDFLSFPFSIECARATTQVPLVRSRCRHKVVLAQVLKYLGNLHASHRYIVPCRQTLTDQKVLAVTSVDSPANCQHPIAPKPLSPFQSIPRSLVSLSLSLHLHLFAFATNYIGER